MSTMIQATIYSTKTPKGSTPVFEIAPPAHVFDSFITYFSIILRILCSSRVIIIALTPDYLSLPHCVREVCNSLLAFLQTAFNHENH
jgi:hypothetical protein